MFSFMFEVCFLRVVQRVSDETVSIYAFQTVKLKLRALKMTLHFVLVNCNLKYIASAMFLYHYAFIADFMAEVRYCVVDLKNVF